MTLPGTEKQKSPDSPESGAGPTVAELARGIIAEYADTLSADNCRTDLEKSVGPALDHARDMVRRLEPSVILDPSKRSRSPLARFLFASREEELDVLRQASRVRQVFVRQAERCAFLLTMRRREYELLGTELENDMVRSGVLQHAVEFLEHNVPLAAPGLEELEHMLVREIVRYLAAIVPTRVRQNRSAKAEIMRSEELLKAQLHTLEQARREEHRPFAVPDALRGKVNEGERELEAMEAKLRALPLAQDTMHCLKETRQMLEEPEPHIRLERVAMRVDDFGIKSDKGEPVAVHECVYDNGRRMAVVIAEISRETAMALWPDIRADKA